MVAAISLFALILGLVVLSVIFSYAIVWYESANADPKLLELRFAPASLWLAAQLLFMEITFLLTTVILHPLGWFPPRERPPSAGGRTPVILLHGLFHNRSCWLWARYYLRKRAIGGIHTLNLPPWKDIESLTERLAKKVDELRHSGGIEKVHLVGHSMGGIVARNYFQLRGGDQKVDRCILLGVPNGGSKLAPFALSPLGRLLMPGSEFLTRLAEAVFPPEITAKVIFSRHDNMVQPYTSARLDGAANLQLNGMGHVALLFHSRSLEAVAEALSEGGPP
jgi:triacylglycerol lipase